MNKRTTKDFEAIFNTEINVGTAICVIAAIQLACRHPQYTGKGKDIAEKFARTLQAEVVAIKPLFAELLRLGWDPAHDIIY